MTDCVLLGSNDRVRWTRVDLTRRPPAFSIYRIVVARSAQDKARLFGVHLRGWVLESADAPAADRGATGAEGDVGAPGARPDDAEVMLAVGPQGESGAQGAPGEEMDPQPSPPPPEFDGPAGETGPAGDPGAAREPTEEEIAAAVATALASATATAPAGDAGVAGDPGPTGPVGAPGDPATAQPSETEITDAVAAAAASSTGEAGVGGAEGAPGRTDFAGGVHVVSVSAAAVPPAISADFQEDEASGGGSSSSSSAFTCTCVATMVLPGAGNFWLDVPDLRLMQPVGSAAATSATLRSVSLSITTGDGGGSGGGPKTFTVRFAPGEYLAEDSSLLPAEFAKWHVRAVSSSVEDCTVTVRVTATWDQPPEELDPAGLHFVVVAADAPALVAFPAP